MGLGLLLFVVITVVNGDPFTALAARGAQSDLDAQLAMSTAAFEGGSGTSGETQAPDPRLTNAAAAKYRKSLGVGDAAGRIQIQPIGVRSVVVNGTSVNDLRKGPGFYPQTAFPGQGRPVAIAGHRTTYGAPFLDVDKMQAGMPIKLTMPYGTFIYKVTRTEIIEPTDWSIIQTGAALPPGLQKKVAAGAPCPGGNCEHLVLTACNPKYSAAQRIAVFAVLESVTPAG